MPRTAQRKAAPREVPPSSRKLRPSVVLAAVLSKLPYRSTSLNSVRPFPAHGRRRPYRNSRSRPTMNDRANTSSRESRNNFCQPPRFGRSSAVRSQRPLMPEAQLRRPLIQIRIHSRNRRGTRSHSCNHRDTHSHSPSPPRPDQGRPIPVHCSSPSGSRRNSNPNRRRASPRCATAMPAAHSAVPARAAPAATMPTSAMPTAAPKCRSWGTSD